jgi:hypothetical protein
LLAQEHLALPLAEFLLHLRLDLFLRLEHPDLALHVDEHATYPAKPPQAPDRPAAPAAEPATPTRADRPGFDRRIDELMDRAKKAQPGTP